MSYAKLAGLEPIYGLCNGITKFHVTKIYELLLYWEILAWFFFFFFGCCKLHMYTMGFESMTLPSDHSYRREKCHLSYYPLARNIVLIYFGNYIQMDNVESVKSMIRKIIIFKDATKRKFWHTWWCTDSFAYLAYINYEKHFMIHNHILHSCVTTCVISHLILQSYISSLITVTSWK